jgi:hypothetical protein
VSTQATEGLRLTVSLRPKKNKKGMDVSLLPQVTWITLMCSTTPIFPLSTAQLLVSTTQPKKPPKSSLPQSVPHSEPPKVNEPKRSKNKKRNERSAREMMMEANPTRLNNSLLLEKPRSKSLKSRNKSLGGES